jgi:hypothetical protein
MLGLQPGESRHATRKHFFNCSGMTALPLEPPHSLLTAVGRVSQRRQRSAGFSALLDISPSYGLGTLRAIEKSSSP